MNKIIDNDKDVSLRGSLITEKDLTDLNYQVKTVYNAYHKKQDQLQAALGLQEYANRLVKKLKPKRNEINRH